MSELIILSKLALCMESEWISQRGRNTSQLYIYLYISTSGWYSQWCHQMCMTLSALRFPSNMTSTASTICTTFKNWGHQGDGCWRSGVWLLTEESFFFLFLAVYVFCFVLFFLYRIFLPVGWFQFNYIQAPFHSLTSCFLVNVFLVTSFFLQVLICTSLQQHRPVNSKNCPLLWKSDNFSLSEQFTMWVSLGYIHMCVVLWDTLYKSCCTMYFGKPLQPFKIQERSLWLKNYFLSVPL